MSKQTALDIRLINELDKENPSINLIKILVGLGANPNSQDVWGRSILYKLAYSMDDHRDMLNLMLDLGANVNAVHIDEEGETCMYGILYGPIILGNVRHVELLVSRGVDTTTPFRVMRFTHNISNIESNVALAMSQSSICEKPIPKYKEILKILIVNGHVDTKKELEQGEYYTEATKKLVIELTELREVVNKLFLEPDDSSTCVLIGGMETINHQEKEEIISKLAKIKMQDACLEIQNSQTKEQLQKSLCKRQIFSKALDILNEININLSECAKEMHKILDECCGLQGPVLSLFALAASKVPSDSIQTLQTDIQEIVAALPQALHYQEAIDILDIPGAELIGDDYTSES